MLGADDNMKHVLFWVILASVAAWFIAAHRGSAPERAGSFRTVDSSRRSLDQAHRDAQRSASEARRQAKRAMAQARQEIQQALQQARQEVHEALHEAHQEVQEALAESGGQSSGKQSTQTPLPAQPQDADGLPGFPGLVPHPELSNNLSSPESFVPALAEKSSTTTTSSETSRTIVGLISDTEEGAREEARKKLDVEVADWLQVDGIPRSWRPSSPLVDAVIVDSKIRPISTEYGTGYKVYEAQLKVDLSPQRRAAFRQSYQRQLVHGRLVLLGGALVFILTCLGVVSGYIRTDEATKGYYTNRLRLLAAAGIGAAGMAIYHVLV
jgi:gas vesicle protein